MRELWKLNPYIAKYPHLLLGGIAGGAEGSGL